MDEVGFIVAELVDNFLLSWFLDIILNVDNVLNDCEVVFEVEVIVGMLYVELGWDCDVVVVDLLEIGEAIICL